MKQLIFFLFLSAYAVTGQNFLDKEFYLVDSLEASVVTPIEKASMDSVLEIYKSTSSEEKELEILNYLSEEINNDNIWPKYNKLRLEFSFNRMFNSSLSKKIRDEYKRSYAEGINGLGQIEMSKGNLMRSMDYYYESLRLLEGVGKSEDYAWVYSNMGANYYQQEDFEKAELYLTMCYDSVKNTNHHDLHALALNDLAVINRNKGDFNKAVELHLKSLDLSIEHNNLLGCALTYSNIGQIYCLEFEDSIEVGIDYLFTSIDMFVDLGIDSWISLTYGKLAKTFVRIRELDKASEFAQLSYEFALKADQSQPLLRAYEALTDVKRAQKDDSSAFEFFEKYVQLKDSLYNVDLKVSALRKELEYQYLIEKELAIKESDSKLAISQAKNRQREILFYGILLISLLIIIFAIFQRRVIKQVSEKNKRIRKQSEERKILLQEIHHRVKNNFQIVCSLLSLQANEEENEVIQAAFESAVNRIQSMAEVHQILYKEESFSDITPENYFNKLTRALQHTGMDKRINYHISSEVDKLGINTMIGLGISTNELITNSVKHGFNGSVEQPKISIDLKKIGNEYLLIYKDNGTGIDTATFKTSFGSELIQIMMEQFNGKLEYKSPSNGAEIHLRFRDTN
ncbi:MAG: tetratricopeptide repeat protein [Crocinitomicaceae bacterium]|nr:tetratricopeptide repeat protein [Crocinitomicaceae bacterium]